MCVVALPPFVFLVVPLLSFCFSLSYGSCLGVCVSPFLAGPQPQPPQPPPFCSFALPLADRRAARPRTEKLTDQPRGSQTANLRGSSNGTRGEGG